VGCRVSRADTSAVAKLVKPWAAWTPVYDRKSTGIVCQANSAGRASLHLVLPTDRLDFLVYKAHGGIELLAVSPIATRVDQRGFSILLTDDDALQADEIVQFDG
jgi:hypothetical protein